MKIIIIIYLILSSTQCISQTIKITNGNYFQNGKFISIPAIYIADGKFAFKEPMSIDTVIDLSNKFIVPPFAEAHTHKLDNPNEIVKDIDNYLSDGVLYVLVLNNFSSNVTNNRNYLIQKNQIDAAFANGGITATGQHPSFAYERILSGINEWWLPVNSKKIKNSRKAENDAYWFMDNIDDVKLKWDSYLKTKPDIVKVYLMNIDKNESQETKSLSEDVLRHIVRKAKKQNLRVIAHIESFYDLKVALRCGVSLFGHMPSYNVNFFEKHPEPLLFTKYDKKLIKRLNPTIIPTLSFNEDFSIVRNEKNNYQGYFDTTLFKRSLNFQKERIKALSDAGFKFAIGSDREYLSQELFYWFKYSIFSAEDILSIATRETAKLIFPNRKIGEFKEGYEGSFLVFETNPLDNYEVLKQAKLIVKKGRVIP